MIKRNRAAGCHAEAVLENVKTINDAVADRGGLSIVALCGKASPVYYFLDSNNFDDVTFTFL